MRDYAAVRLAQSDEENATRTAHRDHYLAFAEEAGRHLEGSDDTPWRAALAVDYPNLRTALAWSRDRHHTQVLARLVASLSPLWYSAGPHQEGEAWLDAVLEQGSGLAPELRARVLYGRCQIDTVHFDAGVLAAHSEEGIRLAAHLDARGC